MFIRLAKLSLLFVLIGANTVIAADQKPNLLLIFVDNVGYGDLGCYGNRDAITPRIDQLAKQGVRCTDFYIGSPSCSPSRGAILTGRHPERNGLNYQLSSDPNMQQGLPSNEIVLPQLLKPLGYACGAFGKWNIGFDSGLRPTERGFDEFFGHRSGNIHYYKGLYHGQNDIRRGTEEADLGGQYSTDAFADAASDFIRRHAKQPWFVYLPFNATHFIGQNNVEPDEKVQWQAPAAALARYGCQPDEPNQRKRFLATLTALDDGVGKILDTLDRENLTQRTLVMFISDNGAFMLPGRGLEVQSNAPLRSGGVTTCEGGVRVPAIFRWPGHLMQGSVNHAMLSSLDVVPLAVSVAGGNLPTDRVYDGIDPLPALRHETDLADRTLHWVWNQSRSQQWRGLRDGNFKLLRSADDAAWELYDLSNDLAEQHNLAKVQPQRLAELVERFEKWQKDIATDPSRSQSLRE